MERLVEGWTEPIRQQLLADGAPFDATGVTLELVLKDNAGNSVSTSGKTAWDTASTSIAKFTPGSSDLTAAGSPYTATWKLTSGSQVAFYPAPASDQWFVRTA